MAATLVPMSNSFRKRSCSEPTCASLPGDPVSRSIACGRNARFIDGKNVAGSCPLLEVQLHSANLKVIQDLPDSRFERRIVSPIPGNEFLYDRSQCRGRQLLMGNSHALTIT